MTQNGRKDLVNAVERLLEEHKYLLVGDRLPKKQRRDNLFNSNNPPKRYSREVEVGTGIYDIAIHVDFYIIGLPSFNSELIIECKFQQTSGSVDEKFPYLNLNIQNCYPAPAIVLIEGQGIKQGAIDWFKEQVNHNSNLRGVYNLSSFHEFASKNF